MILKKFISLLLAVLVTVSVSITAFATTVDPEDIRDETGAVGKQSADVTINITDENGKPLNPTLVYRVVVSWKDLEFKVQASEVHWIPVGRYYWLEGGALVPDQRGYVTVTNHSNAPVTVTAAFEGAEEDPLVSKSTGGIRAGMVLTTGELTDGALVIDSAEGCGDSPPYIQYTVTPAGTPDRVPDLQYIVDTINLTIEK